MAPLCYRQRWGICDPGDQITREIYHRSSSKFVTFFTIRFPDGSVEQKENPLSLDESQISFQGAACGLEIHHKLPNRISHG